MTLALTDITNHEACLAFAMGHKVWISLPGHSIYGDPTTYVLCTDFHDDVPIGLGTYFAEDECIAAIKVAAALDAEPPAERALSVASFMEPSFVPTPADPVLQSIIDSFVDIPFGEEP